jgi:hypothetical protein
MFQALQLAGYVVWTDIQIKSTMEDNFTSMSDRYMDERYEDEREDRDSSMSRVLGP